MKETILTMLNLTLCSLGGGFLSLLFFYMALLRKKRDIFKPFEIFNEFTTIGLLLLIEHVAFSLPLVKYPLIFILSCFFFLNCSSKVLRNENRRFRLMYLSMGYDKREYSWGYLKRNLKTVFLEPLIILFIFHLLILNMHILNMFIVGFILVVGGVTISLLRMR
ncbi:MAG: hypothetical protein B5M49_00920 [Thermotoga sp. 4484_232]|nr:MAG: hypothetical protein B5M49_00920 [Thermotoga sp. 4484_232]RKX41380.1 MAG: hypothetical protein DRP23_00760 [Thermotogota bacterium]RKX57104.1 MAG: hypothetical protein DRP24_01380 [Thermotoga sp.]